MELDQLWQDLNLGSLINGVTTFDDAINKENRQALPDPLKKHQKSWSKPGHSVLKDRFKAKPHKPKIITKEKIKELADPVKGKYSLSYGLIKKEETQKHEEGESENVTKPITTPSFFLTANAQDELDDGPHSNHRNLTSVRNKFENAIHRQLKPKSKSNSKINPSISKLKPTIHQKGNKISPIFPSILASNGRAERAKHDIPNRTQRRDEILKKLNKKTQRTGNSGEGRGKVQGNSNEESDEESLTEGADKQFQFAFIRDPVNRNYVPPASKPFPSKVPLQSGNTKTPLPLRRSQSATNNRDRERVSERESEGEEEKEKEKEKGFMKLTKMKMIMKKKANEKESESENNRDRESQKGSESESERERERDVVVLRERAKDAGRLRVIREVKGAREGKGGGGEMHRKQSRSAPSLLSGLERITPSHPFSSAPNAYNGNSSSSSSFTSSSSNYNNNNKSNSNNNSNSSSNSNNNNNNNNSNNTNNGSSTISNINSNPQGKSSSVSLASNGPRRGSESEKRRVDKKRESERERERERNESGSDLHGAGREGNEYIDLGGGGAEGGEGGELSTIDFGFSPPRNNDNNLSASSSSLSSSSSSSNFSPRLSHSTLVTHIDPTNPNHTLHSHTHLNDNDDNNSNNKINDNDNEYLKMKIEVSDRYPSSLNEPPPSLPSTTQSNPYPYGMKKNNVLPKLTENLFPSTRGQQQEPEPHSQQKNNKKVTSSSSPSSSSYSSKINIDLFKDEKDSREVKDPFLSYSANTLTATLAKHAQRLGSKLSAAEKHSQNYRELATTGGMPIPFSSSSMSQPIPPIPSSSTPTVGVPSSNQMNDS